LDLNWVFPGPLLALFIGLVFLLLVVIINTILLSIGLLLGRRGSLDQSFYSLSSTYWLSF